MFKKLRLEYLFGRLDLFLKYEIRSDDDLHCHCSFYNYLILNSEEQLSCGKPKTKNLKHDWIILYEPQPYV